MALPGLAIKIVHVRIWHESLHRQVSASAKAALPRGNRQHSAPPSIEDIPLAN
jgi:hypothetical protein